MLHLFDLKLVEELLDRGVVDEWSVEAAQVKSHKKAACKKKLARRPQTTDGGTPPAPDPKLSDVRMPVIDVECRCCGTKGSYLRTELMKSFGAGISFSRLRRRAAMGCEFMSGPDGDRCQTRFPCLDTDQS